MAGGMKVCLEVFTRSCQIVFFHHENSRRLKTPCHDPQTSAQTGDMTEAKRSNGHSRRNYSPASTHLGPLHVSLLVTSDLTSAEGPTRSSMASPISRLKRYLAVPFCTISP